MKLGLDIGSTTIKCVVLDDENKLIYSTYERHYSQITEKIGEILGTVKGKVPEVVNAKVAMSANLIRYTRCLCLTMSNCRGSRTRLKVKQP